MTISTRIGVFVLRRSSRYRNGMMEWRLFGPFAQSVNETIVESAKNVDLIYCYGCDWIVQDYHRGEWETHNSKPYHTPEESLVAKREQKDRDSSVRFRCFHESALP